MTFCDTMVVPSPCGLLVKTLAYQLKRQSFEPGESKDLNVIRNPLLVAKVVDRQPEVSRSIHAVIVMSPQMKTKTIAGIGSVMECEIMGLTGRQRCKDG